MEQKCLRTMTDKRNLSIESRFGGSELVAGTPVCRLDIFEAHESGSRPSSPNGATVITVLFDAFP